MTEKKVVIDRQEFASKVMELVKIKDSLKVSTSKLEKTETSESIIKKVNKLESSLNKLNNYLFKSEE